MPPLTKDDVKDLSVAKVRTMMQERLDEVAAIKERSEDGTLLNVAGEDAGKATILLQDTNLLGERFDEIKQLEAGDEKVAKLTDFLETPGDAPPPYQRKAAPAAKPKSITQILNESEGLKKAQEGGPVNFKLEIPLETLGFKVLGTDDALAGVSDEYPPQDLRIPGIRVPVLFQRNNAAQLFLPGQTDNTNAIPYMQETVTSEGAAEVLEGSAKPEADISFAEASAPIETIAVTLPATNRLLNNIAFMRSWIESRLRLFVLNREDNQVINGDGIAPNIEGFLTVAGTGTSSYSLAAVASDATLAFDAVYSGLTNVYEAFLDPTGIIMAAGTWERFRLGKDSNNNYLLGPPMNDAPNRLWGLPVTLNERMPAESAANECIAVVAREAAMVARAEALTVAVTDSHASEFTSNILRFRAEMDVAFPIFRPAGISVVTSAA